jgi:hypothetical protein
MTADAHEWLDLYHRTSPERVAEILRTSSMMSLENTNEAFFSTHIGNDESATSGYGTAVVHVRIPAEWVETEWARLDDEFELADGSWESHYAIRVDRLKAKHFVR